MPDSTDILFLYGNDEYAIARRMNELQKVVDKEGMNTARLEARTVSEDDLSNAVNAAPFIAEKRLVFLANPSSRYNSPDARKKLSALIAGLPTTTLLVLHEHVDPREEKDHWLVKQAAKGKMRKERFMSPHQWEMIDWIVKEAKSQGGEIARDAASRLAEMSGENPRQAAQEITKLLTYTNYERPIRLADVEKVSLVTSQANVFAMVDALATGNGKQAQALLRRLLEEEDPFMLWGMVIRQFRLLILAREVIESGGDVPGVQKALGVHEFVAKKIFPQAQRFSMAALESIHHRLLEIDVEVKTGRITLELALEILVAGLVRA